MLGRGISLCLSLLLSLDLSRERGISLLGLFLDRSELFFYTLFWIRQHQSDSTSQYAHNTGGTLNFFLVIIFVLSASEAALDWE